MSAEKTAVPVYLILGSHAHVPHGAGERDFENAYTELVRPFVSTLCRYPDIQAVVHYSGTLLHWMEKSHPELLMLIADMVARKQVEMLGGGFYEPLLPVIPQQDRIGQIELLTTYLRRHFGKRPQGCWIPAFAWEQQLVSPLAACGMSYAFLEERQFQAAGAAPEDLFAPCISEDQGKLITVFPVLRSVEIAPAKKNVLAVCAELRKRLPAGGIVPVFPEPPSGGGGEAADYAWNRFFGELSLPESPVECVTPGKMLKGLNGLKKLGFPDSAGAAGERVTPRRFLIEHPEVNGIYAKMIFTGVLINQLRGDKARKQNAREELWKAQGADILFVAARDGLCRHTLRKAAYRSLIGAERITREKGKFGPSLVQFDFDLDGEAEYLFQDAKINCYIQPLGAGIFELDYLPRSWNYLDAGSGRETGAPLRRTAFADYLLPAAAGDASIFVPGAFPPEGARRCCAEKYAAVPDRLKGKVCFTLQAAGEGDSGSSPLEAIEIEKCFLLKKDVLTVSYSLCNRGPAAGTFRFMSEINLSFSGEGEECVRFYTAAPGAKDTPLASGPGGAIIRGAESLKMHDLKNEAKIQLSSTEPFDGCLTTALTGGEYQSSRIMPLFGISLESGETWRTEFTLRFSH
jgi:hypothetical protein